MVSINQFRQGFLNYVENDILIHLQGFKKVAVGTTVILMAQNEDSINQVLNHPFVKMLNIQQDGNIDIDKLKNAICQYMDSNEKITITFPFIGDFTFSKNDIEKLYQYIIQGGQQ